MEHKDKKIAMSVNNLRLKFPNEHDLIFKDLNITIYEGEKVLLLGPSGCGKSTLLQVLSGLIPNSIEVPLKYDGIKLATSSGFVFQDPDTQFCMPYIDEELAFVLENSLVPREEMNHLIKIVLQQVGLAHIPTHTLINDLSQGMKQRLALASVLLLNPNVLFLDEPSALLDPEGTEQIWHAVKSISAYKTIVIVEHKIEKIAHWVERVILFNNKGEIIADSTPKNIFMQHKQQLIDYGIWYPNVWHDYVHSDSFSQLQLGRKKHLPSKTVLQLQDFKGFYGDEMKINVPFGQVNKGDWLAITGPNGAGKSTLLLSLIQLIRTAGTYILENEKIKYNKKDKSVPVNISFVFQNPELQFITNTIFDELAFTLQLDNVNEQTIKQKVNTLMQTFDIDINEERHPYQLSIGQKRRLSVATAFTQKTRIMLLDEPTFGQDAKNTFIILEQLELLRQGGMTIIMVTHDQRIVEHFATKVWSIDEGKLTSDTVATSKVINY